MSILFCHNFTPYTIGSDDYILNSILDNSSAQVDPSVESDTLFTKVVRVGTVGLGVRDLRIELPASEATVTAGFHTQLAGNYGGSVDGTGIEIVSFEDAGTVQTIIKISSIGEVFAENGGGAEIGRSTAANLFPGANFFFMEVKLTVHNSAGVVEVHVEGDTVLNLTSVDTQNTGNATLDSINFLPGGQPGSADFLPIGDCYITDTASPNANFLDPLLVYSLIPDGDGATNNWTPIGTTTSNYVNIDDSTADDDTSRVETVSTGNKDLYTLADLSTNVDTVYGIQVVTKFRNETSDGETITLTVRSTAGTESDSTTFTPTTAWQYENHIEENLPGSTTGLTVGEINSIQIGQKLTL